MSKTLRTAMIFGNHMILQRNQNNPIWGTCQDGDQITVAFRDCQISVKSTEGRWHAILPAMDSGSSYAMKITSARENRVIVFEDVAVGEVWLAGGQSNMEFPMKFDQDFIDEVKSADNSNLRFFDYPKITREDMLEEFDYSDYGFWRTLTPGNAPYFSAVGYYFQKKIFEDQNVPVGIIGCNWGGTTASAWIREDYLAKDKELVFYLEEYGNVVKNMDFEAYEQKFKAFMTFSRSAESIAFTEDLLRGGVDFTQFFVGIEDLSPEEIAEKFEKNEQPIGPMHRNRPAILYNTMLSNVAPFGIKGVIWYQGESDEDHAEIYDKLLMAVIESWREIWDYEFPFLQVQLAPFEYMPDLPAENFVIIRSKQDAVCKLIPRTYMASIMDSGMKMDIHPKNKRPVGERLALLAIGKVYGKDILCEAPEVSSAIRAGDKIIIEFNHVGTGLYLKGEQVNALQLFYGDKEIRNFITIVQGNKIVINFTDYILHEKLDVRFAWTGYCEVNLYNSADLPAKPFKISV